jgi:D-methionine transport system permease protein
MIIDLLKNTGETLYMIIISGTISVFCGLLMGIYLFLQQHTQLSKPTPLRYVFNVIVNTLRSIPFIILMIAVLPLTRWIVGTGIGDTATLVPLSLAATPFFARLTESALKKLPPGLIEASISLGAKPSAIVFRVLIPEAAADLIRSITITLIALIGYSAMAGAIGAGGLGSFAIQNGYERYDTHVMILTVAVLVLLVQLIQTIGDRIAQQFTH